MKPLEIHVRNKVLFAKISAEEKFLGNFDYTLMDKNGQSIYIFRQEMSKFRLAYGEMAEDVREACIDALILRFDKDCTEMIYYKGVRHVISVSYAAGGSFWGVTINRMSYGSIVFKSDAQFEYHEHHPHELLTPDRMEKYFSWIRLGKIAWPAEWRPGNAPRIG